MTDPASAPLIAPGGLPRLPAAKARLAAEFGVTMPGPALEAFAELDERHSSNKGEAIHGGAYSRSCCG
jgi:hypothetical protein